MDHEEQEKIIPVEPIPISGVVDDDAAAEARAVAGGTLKEEAERAQHKRRERTRDQIGLATAIGVWVAFAIIISGALVWALHMLAPVEYRYLTPEELTQLQSVLSNIIVGALLGFLVKNRFM